MAENVVARAHKMFLAIISYVQSYESAFSALKLSVGRQEGQLGRKKSYFSSLLLETWPNLK